MDLDQALKTLSIFSYSWIILSLFPICEHCLFESQKNLLMDSCWKGQAIYAHVTFIDQVLYSENGWGITCWKTFPDNNGWRT